MYMLHNKWNIQSIHLFQFLRHIQLRKEQELMDRLFRKKLITTILFFTFLFIFALKNIFVVYNPLKKSLKDKNINLSNLDEIPKLIENTINENIYGKYAFVDSYGYLQKVMDKNEENNFEVIKDKQGFFALYIYGTSTQSCI
eukprot:TRINITY_DN45003_c0_g1_i1.p3 TRINITY_DN45003_c0_g1~~TRINITY_DN45003_c0_g1_i1.p3  ORF type:complete len:142 (+),score=13.21 TRINITY_DN45003_c0_g1_i1:279-704(+)